MVLWSSILVSQQIESHSGEPVALEYQVKAAFLLNFTKFVDWPEPQPPGSNAPFAICVLGTNPFGGVLNQIAEGETAAGRKLVVLKVSPAEARGCQVVYFAREDKTSPRIFESGTLTVGEGPKFLAEGGMIAFVLENRRVRFDVNRRAAEQAGLKISSKLLSVARVVER